MNLLPGTDWGCVSPSCGGVLGRIIKGELVIEGGVKANTDGTTIVVMCPLCGRTKVWYAKDRAVVWEFFNVFARRIGDMMRDR